MAKSFGIIGCGGKAAGKILMTNILDEGCEGKIVGFEGLAHREDVIKAEMLGAIGFFCPGMNLREFIFFKNQGGDFPLVLTSGFGFSEFNGKIPNTDAEIDGEKGEIIL